MITHFCSRRNKPYHLSQIISLKTFTHISIYFTVQGVEADGQSGFLEHVNVTNAVTNNNALFFGNICGFRLIWTPIPELMWTLFGA